MKELLIPEVLNMYATTLYNKELSASLKILRLYWILSWQAMSLWAGAARSVVCQGTQWPCPQAFSIEYPLLTHKLRDLYNGLTYHSFA